MRIKLEGKERREREWNEKEEREGVRIKLEGKERREREWNEKEGREGRENKA